MGKVRHSHYPRSVVQKRSNHPSTLQTTVPKQIVSQWQLKPGEILEFVFVTEGFDSFVKVRKVRD